MVVPDLHAFLLQSRNQVQVDKARQTLNTRLRAERTNTNAQDPYRASAADTRAWTMRTPVTPDPPSQRGSSTLGNGV